MPAEDLSRFFKGVQQMLKRSRGAGVCASTIQSDGGSTYNIVGTLLKHRTSRLLPARNLAGIDISAPGLTHIEYDGKYSPFHYIVDQGNAAVLADMLINARRYGAHHDHNPPASKD